MTFESGDPLVARRSQPIIATEGLNFVFVGYSPDAQQIRVIWFDDAAMDWHSRVD